MAILVQQVSDSSEYAAQILNAAELLKDGKLVILPTETVYGAAALLNRPQAVARLKSLRRGAENKPLTIHLAQSEEARHYIGEVGELGFRAIRKLWPGPVGLMFQVPAPRRRQVVERFNVVEADLYDGDSITLRCPEHEVFREVALKAPGPIALAAVEWGSGRRGADLLQELEGKVELILDAGPTRFSKPSTLVKISGDGWEVVRSGVYDARIIDRMLRTTILFVCSGNTCRSPMAEAMAKRFLSRRLSIPEESLEKKGFVVTSAGALAITGARATPQAIDAALALGADASKHRSRPLSVELIHQADVIYVMSRGHAEAVKALAPSSATRLHRLDEDADIEDPIGGDAELYAKVAGRINDLIEKRLPDDVKL
jgi:L-threonylcarbamoyladenylate synthase